MSSRSYAQFCGVAAAMDVLGERWAPLVVRELLDGPQRYSDLLKRLRGASTDMLARRLDELEKAGVVRRVELPPPANTKMYELTDLGRELEPVLYALARWGIRRLVADDAYSDAVYDTRWIELAVRALFSPARGPDTKRTVRFVVDGEPLTVTISFLGLDVVPPDTPADVEIIGTARQLAEILVDPGSMGRRLREGKDGPRVVGDNLGPIFAAFRLDHPQG